MPRDDDTPFINRSNPRFPPKVEPEAAATSPGKSSRWPYVLALVVIALVGWLIRWETVVTADQNQPLFYMVNRWTGEIRAVTGGGYLQVNEVK